MSSPPTNPFRPSANQPPPYLAGREKEQADFAALLKQNVILENLALTGLRGVGKTSLLDSLKPIAQREKWLWVNADLSETIRTEADIITRILADCGRTLSTISVQFPAREGMGFERKEDAHKRPVNTDYLRQVFNQAEGLPTDKLKATLLHVWQILQQIDIPGIVFAYDEAQSLSDRADNDQYPLSILLEVFQSMQRQGMKYLLLLSGLPPLMQKLVAARTYAERMFHVATLSTLDNKATRDAIVQPTEQGFVKFDAKVVKQIIDLSKGYPYFIQFFCKEVYDIGLAQWHENQSVREETLSVKSFPEHTIMEKLDEDFFRGRWENATDRQKNLLMIIANLPNCEKKFSSRDIKDSRMNQTPSAFSSSHITQLLKTMADKGLVYKNRHGSYSLAIPSFSAFIKRQTQP